MAKQIIIELEALYRQLDVRIDSVSKITEIRLENTEKLESEYERLCSGSELEEITNMFLQRYYEIDAQMNKRRQGSLDTTLLTYSFTHAYSLTHSFN